MAVKLRVQFLTKADASGRYLQDCATSGPNGQPAAPLAWSRGFAGHETRLPNWSLGPQPIAGATCIRGRRITSVPITRRFSMLNTTPTAKAGA